MHNGTRQSDSDSGGGGGSRGHDSDGEEEWPVEFRSDLLQAAHIAGPQAGGGSAPPSPNLTAFAEHRHHVPTFMESSGEVDDADVELGRRHSQPARRRFRDAAEDDGYQQKLSLDGEDEKLMLARVEGVESTDYQPLKGGTHMRRLFALAKPEVPILFLYFIFPILFLFKMLIYFNFFVVVQWLMLLGGTISLVVSSGSMLMLPQFAGDIIDAVSKDGGAFHSLLLVAALIAKVLST
jgi:hypothetical protein